MSWLARTLLLGVLAPLVAVNLAAQRHGGVTPGAALPSSTAIGAGALHFGPSATARSAIPAHAPAYRSPGYRSGSRGVGGQAYRSRGVYGRNYRNLPFAYWLAPYYYAPFDY